MPYSTITKLAEQLNNKPKSMSRKQMLDRMRETMARRGWV